MDEKEMDSDKNTSSADCDIGDSIFGSRMSVWSDEGSRHLSELSLFSGISETKAADISTRLSIIVTIFIEDLNNHQQKFGTEFNELCIIQRFLARKSTY